MLQGRLPKSPGCWCWVFSSTLCRCQLENPWKDKLNLESVHSCGAGMQSSRNIVYIQSRGRKDLQASA